MLHRSHVHSIWPSYMCNYSQKEMVMIVDHCLIKGNPCLIISVCYKLTWMHVYILSLYLNLVSRDFPSHFFYKEKP